MVVGEAGLGKTTLLESFFKSFRDEDATSALFERKETRNVIETRRILEEATTRRDVCEREMKASSETADYTRAEARKKEISQLTKEIQVHTENLKLLCAADERRRQELQALRESARSLRMEMKRSADQSIFRLALELKVQAAVMQSEADALSLELKQMRRDEFVGGAREDEEPIEGDHSSIRGSTVRVTPFDPFCITVGKNELQVKLVDTPGYGETLNAEESFDVITHHVEKLFCEMLAAETSSSARDPDRLLSNDPLIHCCLYFIAPHRLKNIDIAFMKRLHQWVNIVPIIAKSDTMTTKEKEEFKLQVRETLAAEGIDAYTFDPHTIRQMEAQDHEEYKMPWAVIGSTDSHLDAGVPVYLRKYPWGNALSSEPSHSDLPALRNLIMWSGQWQDLKMRSRMMYEQWRASRSLAMCTSHAVSAVVGTAVKSARRQYKSVRKATAGAFALTCDNLGLRQSIALRAISIIMLLLVPIPAAALAWSTMQADLSAPRQVILMRQLVDKMAIEKGELSRKYEANLADMSQLLRETQARLESSEKYVKECTLARNIEARAARAAQSQARAALNRAERVQMERTAIASDLSLCKANNTQSFWRQTAESAGRALKETTDKVMSKASSVAAAAAETAGGAVRTSPSFENITTKATSAAKEITSYAREISKGAAAVA